MTATQAQLTALAAIIAEQEQGLADGRFAHPEVMRVRMAENVAVLACWSREVAV